MPRLIAAILRHGDYHQRLHTPSAHQPYPLTDQGQAQATQAVRLIHSMLDEQACTFCPNIDSSQLLRAWQTANIIGQALAELCADSIQLESFYALAERCVGSAANLSIDEIETIVAADPRYPALPASWKSDSHFRLPLQGAESLMDAGERAARHIKARMEALAGQADRDTLKLFVGHGAAFRHAAHHLGVLAFDEIAKLSMYHAQPVLLEYSAEGPWRHVGGDWKLRGNYSEYTD